MTLLYLLHSMVLHLQVHAILSLLSVLLWYVYMPEPCGPSTALMPLGHTHTHPPTLLHHSQLALKHRKNKHGGQRIVIFVGSPIVETANQLKKLGKALKKNNVHLDVVAMGENDVNQDKLTTLIEAVGTGGAADEASHLVVVEPGTLPSDALVATGILGAAGGGGGGAGGAGGFDGFDFDPNMDPELASVLRMSLEEAQGGAAAAGQTTGAADSAAGSTHGTPAGEGTGSQAGGTPAPAGASPAPHTWHSAGDEDDELQRALAMSLADMGAAPSPAPSPAATPAPAPAPAPAPSPAPAPAASSEAAAAPAPAPAPADAPAPSGATAFEDSAWVSELLGGVEGADMSDPEVLAALQALHDHANQGSGQGQGDDDAEDQGEGKQ